MNRHRIFLEIAPTAKGRPRLGRFGHVYTPVRTAKAEHALAMAVMDQWPFGSMAVPMAVRMIFHFSNPTSRKRKRSGPHVCRPDLDNCVKLVKDALNGVIWDDDAQIFSLKAKKVWNPLAYGIELVVIWNYSSGNTQGGDDDD